MSDPGASRATARSLVERIDPLDATEAEHRLDALAWVDSGAPLLRTAKPATPPKHLVAYSLVIDAGRTRALLIDHRLSGLWLPAGGHVEPGEHPADTAMRELDEELAIDGSFLDPWDRAPFFVTVTSTVDPDASHVDVSLWFAFATDPSAAITVDRREATEARWWPFDRIGADPGVGFDPHLPRAVAKLADRSAGRGAAARLEG